MKKYVWSLLLICNFCLGQKDLSQQVRIILENDKLFYTDKYYTNGLFIDYKKNLTQDFLFFKVKETVNQLEFTLGSEVYTPTNLTSTNPKYFDRPYAGWTFLNATVNQIDQRVAHSYGVELGVTGTMSFANDIQSWWHNVLSVQEPTWTQQIDSKFLVNLKYQLLYSYDLCSNVSLIYKVQPTLGLKDVFLENNVSLYIGKLNGFKNSSRSGDIDTTKTSEFYFVLGIGHRYVAHNSLIQGDLNYNDKTFTSPIEHHIIKFNSSLVYKSERHLWQFGVNYNTNETPKSSSHSYGKIAYGFLF